MPAGFFEADALTVARRLIGCVLVSELGGTCCSGRIVETEAYPNDDPAYRGWRAYDEKLGRVQPQGRARALFDGPGRALVYRLYGRHVLLNLVTGDAGRPGAVLLRALEPAVGLPAMRRRRGVAAAERLCRGPGNLTRALAVSLDQHGLPLTRARGLYLTEPEEAPLPEIRTTRRVGLRHGQALPYRFVVAGHRCVSR